LYINKIYFFLYYLTLLKSYNYHMKVENEDSFSKKILLALTGLGGCTLIFLLYKNIIQNKKKSISFL
jgi:hypothetical protein